nr:hypothetical protein [Nocardia australiensis]
MSALFVARGSIGLGFDQVGSARVLLDRRTCTHAREAEITDQEQAWGGPLWPAADLITPMAIRVAATLRVADAIVAGVSSGPELAIHLAVEVDPFVRVLDHLVTAGFLRRDEGGAYTLTDAGQWLRDDHPEGVRASIDLEGAIGHADMSVVELLHTVRTSCGTARRQRGPTARSSSSKTPSTRKTPVPRWIYACSPTASAENEASMGSPASRTKPGSLSVRSLTRGSVPLSSSAGSVCAANQLKIRLR